MAKRAVLIGCNYPGTKAELHGCVNDVTRMYKCLVDRFGFSEDDITVMVDTDKRSVQPTGANIKRVLNQLIGESVPGDILVMHFSGHGTQVPDETGDDDTGLDEAIVPTDLNLLTDDDFRLLFNNIPRGVQFTFISDSCHSGGLIDHEKEQIGGGPGAAATRGLAPPSQSRVATRSYDAGYERDPSEYASRGGRHGHQGRREEPQYEREEGYGRHGRREEPEYEREEGYGRHGRRGESEYEREEGYGRHHGRREEPAYYEEEPRREGYGHQEGHRPERYGQGAGYGGGYQQGGGYGQEASYGGGYQQGGGYGQGPSYGAGYQQGEGYGQGASYGAGYQQEGGYERQVPHKNKSLSIQTLTEMLSEQAGHQVQPGNIRTSLYDIFGEDASPTVKVFVNLIASKMGGGGGGDGESGSAVGGGLLGTIGALAMDFMKAKLNDGDSSFALPGPVDSNAVRQSAHAGVKPPRSARLADDVGTLVSGCQSNETSADANPTGNPAQAYGALSNGIQTILNQTNGSLTNGQLVTAVRDLLKKQGFTQHPCLYSSDENVHSLFICE